MSTLNATVVILRESLVDIGFHLLSNFLMGSKIKLRLVSRDIDPATQEGKRSPEADLKIWGWDGKPHPHAADDLYSYIAVKFCIPSDFGTPGAILVTSQHSNEFFLKSISLDTPDGNEIYFPCNSWINIAKPHEGPRIFFVNEAYLPNQTPLGLLKLRHDELMNLQGDGKGERQTDDRIYDYDVYNDLGNPDSKKESARPVLGGSKELPYPRRCRSGRKATNSDPKSEETGSLYVPRDDHFSPTKYRQFIAAGIRCFGHDIAIYFENLLSEAKHFNLLDEVHDLYVGALREARPGLVNASRNPGDGTIADYPPPAIVQASKEAWRTDEEFARQRLAGMNPLVISRLTVFPPVSKLDPEVYGPPTSSITRKHLESNLDGLTVEEALDHKRLYLLDYHDAFLPFVEKINALNGKTYASRTIFFLTKAGILKPIAIELSLPPKCKGEKCESRVFTAPPPGVTDWLWRLAKTHVAVADLGYHELCSHWLRAHASIEPFIIATHRQLSALHPVHQLLSPHFKDTMHINALARASLISAGGYIEETFTPGRYCMEMSSVLYKNWRFDEESLPRDLIKRGMAERDEKEVHGLKLNIPDYPYAVDGLDLWWAIESWVKDYVRIYYKDNAAVKSDEELQKWWKEIKEVGHGDHKDAHWWVAMDKVEELEEVLSTVIWLASGHHAAVNFGQYAYAGFMPNAPTMSYKFIPEQGSQEYLEMCKDPEKYFLTIVATKGQATLIMAVGEVLSQHMGDEEYLGKRGDPKWTSNKKVVAAFEEFGRNVQMAEANMVARNESKDPLKLAHRIGPSLVPYTLLYPSSSEGLTLRGVPNSISI